MFGPRLAGAARFASCMRTSAKPSRLTNGISTPKQDLSQNWPPNRRPPCKGRPPHRWRPLPAAVRKATATNTIFSLRQSAHAAIHGQVLAGDVLARIGCKQRAQALGVFVVAQAAQGAWAARFSSPSVLSRPGHLAREKARTDGVDADAVLAPFACQRAGEIDYRRLGGVVAMVFMPCGLPPRPAMDATLMMLPLRRPIMLCPATYWLSRK